MASCPRWANNHAMRAFDLASLDFAHLSSQVNLQLNRVPTARNLKRAILAMNNSRIIGKRCDMLLGWHRTFISEDDRDGIDATIALVGFLPRMGATGVVYQYRLMDVLVHKHALARLFERALQPPEAVAAALLHPGFLSGFPREVVDETLPGFEAPFQDGKFVGSREWVRDEEGNTISMFGIRSWLPDPIACFSWTKKVSRTLGRAIESEPKKQVLDLLRQR